LFPTLFQRTLVGKKNIIALLLCQQRSPDATFSSSQYDETLTHASSISYSARSDFSALPSFLKAGLLSGRPPGEIRTGGVLQKYWF
ncbi:MAG: hypothetical protein JNN29_11100, partial [Chitinophagaceae bacterium]|nr:hypothetical protein [Chitinophagaceae bacterium]